MKWPFKPDHFITEEAQSQSQGEPESKHQMKVSFSEGVYQTNRQECDELHPTTDIKVRIQLQQGTPVNTGQKIKVQLYFSASLCVQVLRQ